MAPKSSTARRLTAFQLLEAVKSNSAAAKESISQHGMPASYKTLNEHSFLRTAVEHGYTDLVKVMLRRGCSLNGDPGKLHYGTPLHVAIEMQNIEMVSVLLQHMAPLEATREGGQTPLHYAVKSKQKGIIQLLLQYGANWKAVDDKGMTVLHFAIEDSVGCWRSGPYYAVTRPKVKSGTAQDITEILKLFLVRGMTADIKTRDGQTPLHFAVKRHLKSVVEFLLMHNANLHACNINKDSLLHIAVKDGNAKSPCNGATSEQILENEKKKAKFVTWLISKGAKVDLLNKDGETPLQLAVKHNQKQIFPVLLQHAKKLDTHDSKHNTVLHMLLELNKNSNQNQIAEILKVVEMLLKKGLTVNQVNVDGETPIHLAAKYNQREILEILLPRFTNVNACNKNKDTILHTLANTRVSDDEDKDYAKIAQILLLKGAICNMRNANGETPLLLAAKYKRKELSDVLVKHGADVNICSNDGKNVLHFLSLVKMDTDEVKAREMVKLFVTQGCDVNARTRRNMTALHLSAQSGCNSIVQALIENGADVKSTERIRLYTPLHVAAQNNHADVVETLLKSKADVDARERSGKTTLHIAIQHADHAVMKKLVIHNADIEAADENGKIALHYACWYERTNCISDLLHFGADVNAKDSFGYPSILYVSKVSRNVMGKLMLHLIKLQAANLPLDRKNADCIHTRSNQLNTFFASCLEEVSKMEKTLIDGHTSIYNVLHMSLNQLAVYKQNTGFRKIVCSMDFKQRFPIYGNLILAAYRRGIVRNGLMESAKESLQQIIEMNLPGSCIEKIFSFLDNTSLRDLIKAENVNVRKRRVASVEDLQYSAKRQRVA